MFSTTSGNLVCMEISTISVLFELRLKCAIFVRIAQFSFVLCTNSLTANTLLQMCSKQMAPTPLPPYPPLQQRRGVISEEEKEKNLYIFMYS